MVLVKEDNGRQGAGQLSAWGLLSAAISVVAVVTVSGFLSKFWWVFDVVSSFRFLAAEAALLAAVLYALGKRWKPCLGAVALMVLNGCMIVPDYFRPSRDLLSPQTYKCLLLNVYTANTNHQRVVDYIMQENPDFFVLQEINKNWVLGLAELRKRYPYYIEEPEEDNFGIGFYSRYPVKGMQVRYIGEINVASITAVVQLRDRSITVIGTHPVPPSGADYWRWRNEQLERLADYINTCDGEVLLLGDLNTTPWSYYFKHFVETTALKDSREGFGPQLSWPAFCPVTGVSIDHCLISESVQIANRRIGPNVGSDHFPVVVDFGFKHVQY